MYRLIKKIVYLFTFYCCLDFLFFDFPVPAVSFPDAVVFFDVFLQFFYFFWKQGNDVPESKSAIRSKPPPEAMGILLRVKGPYTVLVPDFFTV